MKELLQSDLIFGSCRFADLHLLSPIRTFLLLAALHFQIRNLPIANQASSECTVFLCLLRSYLKCFTPYSVSMGVSHIESVHVVSSEVRVQMMKKCKKRGILYDLFLLYRIRRPKSVNCLVKMCYFASIAALIDQSDSNPNY